MKYRENMRRNYGETAEKIANAMQANPNITTNEIAEMLNKSLSTIEKTIRKLKKDKIVKRVGSDRSGYWKVL